LLAAVACGGEAPRESAPEAVAPAFRAVLLTAGPVGDAGWYEGAYRGLLMLHDSLGAEVQHQQTSASADFDEAFRSYASAGYDLIFAHGFEYQDAAVRVGEEFPDVTIIVSGGGKVSENVVPLIFTLEEGTYLAGMVAAGMTQTGTLGMVGGLPIPSVQGTFRAFEAGARAVRPDVAFVESYIGSWNDLRAAKDSAAAQLRGGADVLIHNTDAASFGVFQAVREAADAGDRVWAIGMNNDQNGVTPEVTLGSAVIDIPTAFLKAARAWQAGEVSGKPVYEGMADGVIDFVVNPAVADHIPADLLRRVAEARERIRSGALTVPRVPFVDGEPGADTTAGGA
jgi:basic membrane lipoprotein Med (substrate-binding protein (PBP1-ABC) superfamily)